jgi:RNA polymerase sigma factor for flagellar operon FliA
MHTAAATPPASRPSASQAEALWRAWSIKKDSRARDQLVLSYAPMVRYLASRKVRELPAHCDVDDLESCGLIALVESVDRFDPAKGATFEQYAWTRVSGAILDELRRQDWAPRSVRRITRKADQASEKLYATTGEAPSQEAVAETIGVGVDELKHALSELGRAELLSLNAPARLGEDGGYVEIGDTVESSDLGSPERVVLARERSQRIRNAISALDPREQQVLSLVHVHSVPGAEIGRMLGVTESRVSQILSGVRTKLRRSLDEYERAATVAVA